MKWIIRIILVVLGIFLVLLTGYLLWLVLRAHWPAILFFGFLIVGVAVAASSLWFVQKQLRSTLQGALLLAIAEARGSRSRQMVERALWFGSIASGGWLYNVAQDISNFLSRRATRSFIQQAMTVISKGLFIKLAFIPLPLLLVCYIISTFSTNAHYWGHFFTILLLMNIVLRLMIYATGSPSLPVRLRRELTSPVVSFFSIALFDLLGIIFAFQFIFPSQSGQGSSVDLVSLQSVLSNLFFAHILDLGRDILTARDPSLSHLVMNIVGVLYSFVILETAYRFHEFRRSDEDHVAIGTTYNLLGRFTDALKSIEKSKTPTASSLLSYAVAHLGVNQFDRAWTDAQQALRIQGENESSEYVFLILQFLTVAYSLPFMIRKTLIERGISLSIPDFVIAYAILSLTSVERITEDELNQLSVQLFQESDISTHYPLAQATLLLAIDKREEGRMLLGTVIPRNPEDEIYKVYLELLTIITDPTTSVEEDRKQFDIWSAQSLSKFSQWVETKTNLKQHRAIVLGVLEGVHSAATRYQSEYRQSWLFIVNELAKLIAADPSWKFGPQGPERMLGSLRTSFG